MQWLLALALPTYACDCGEGESLIFGPGKVAAVPPNATLLYFYRGPEEHLQEYFRDAQILTETAGLIPLEVVSRWKVEGGWYVEAKSPRPLEEGKLYSIVHFNSFYPSFVVDLSFEVRHGSDTMPPPLSVSSATFKPVSDKCTTGARYVVIEATTTGERDNAPLFLEVLSPSSTDAASGHPILIVPFEAVATGTTKVEIGAKSFCDRAPFVTSNGALDLLVRLRDMAGNVGPATHVLVLP